MNTNFTVEYMERPEVTVAIVRHENRDAPFIGICINGAGMPQRLARFRAISDAFDRAHSLSVLDAMMPEETAA